MFLPIERYQKYMKLMPGVILGCGWNVLKEILVDLTDNTCASTKDRFRHRCM